MELTEYKQLMLRKCSKNHVPISGTFELTSSCNLNCRMCYIHEKNNRNICNENDAAYWVKLGRMCRDRGMLFLLLTGGEPLIRPDFMDIYEALYDMGFLITINSNGTLWNEAVIRKLQERPPVQINISLYGSSQDTYRRLCGSAESYDKVMANLQHMKAAGFKIRLNFTMTKFNAPDLDEMICYAKSQNLGFNGTAYLFEHQATYGIDDILSAETCRLEPEMAGEIMAKMRIEGMSKEQKESFKERLRCEEEHLAGVAAHSAASCSAGRSSFWITHDGCFKACGMFKDGIELGNPTDFVKGWDVICLSTDKVKAREACSCCTYKNWCMMCKATSGIKETSYICRMTKKYKTWLLEYLEKGGIVES